MQEPNKIILNSIINKLDEVVAIRSVLSSDKWFIFRKDGTEVTVEIFKDKIKRSNWPLTAKEANHIIKQLKQ